MAGPTETTAHGRAFAGALATCLALLVPLSSARATEGELTPAQAEQELSEAVQAVNGGSAAAPAADLTAELRDLVLALPALDADDRRQARALLARPTDGGSENGVIPGAGWGVVEDPLSPLCDANFCVHWVGLSGGSDNDDRPKPGDAGGLAGVPDYVEKTLEVAQFSALVQNGTLGWPDPKSDGSAGTPGNAAHAGKTDVYLSDICTGDDCYYGYANIDDTSATCNGVPFKCAAYLVLDNDYAEFSYPNEDIPLAATMAHEYNHVLQFNLDSFQDWWMFESTATWAEERVFPEGVDDWVSTYMPRWVNGPQFPITDFGAQDGLRVYGSAVWNHWLDERFGPRVILQAWKQSRRTRPTDFAAAAYDLAIKRREGAGFAPEFARFAAATSEWRTGDGGFPDSDDLGDVTRAGGVAFGSPRSFRLDHTAYRLMNVTSRGPEMVLKVRAARRTRTGIALVGRDGDKLGGAVVRKVRFLPAGGTGTVRLADTNRFERITAVVANADARVSGFGAGDWAYSRDNRRFEVALRRG